MGLPEAQSTQGPVGRPAVDAVQANPRWYFLSGTFEIDTFLGLMISEAVFHGSSDIAVSKIDRWWVAMSTDDWLRDAPGAFEAPTPDPARGDNVSRVEVLLTAFCSRVITVGSGAVTHVVGAEAPPERAQALLDDPRFARVIVFCPPSTSEERLGTAERRLQLVPDPTPAAFEAVRAGFDDKAAEFLRPRRTP